MIEGLPTHAHYTERFAEYYRRLGFHGQVVDGTLWLEEHRMIFPLGPASLSYVIPKSTAKELLSSSRKAVLVRFTDGFGGHGTTGKWYAVICRQFLDLSQYNSKNRNQIKKGLEQCAVKKVDAEYLARSGYDVYLAARTRYAEDIGSIRPKAAGQFKDDILVAKDFDDVIDFWGVFHRDALVGYALNHRYGSTEVAYSSMAFHPEYFKFYPAYALIYQMNEYYLRDQSFAYVNDGYKNVGHKTNIQDLLIHKFGFRKTPTNLFVRYRPWLAAALWIPRFAKQWLSNRSPKYATLCALDDARTRP